MAERETDAQGRYKVLTPYEYQTNVVDFYGQTLGATGIEVETPIEEEPVEKTTYVAPNIFSDDGNEPSNILSQPLGSLNKTTNNFANFENLTFQTNTFDTASSYGDYLSSKGSNKSDLSAIEKSIDKKLGSVADKVNKTISEKYGLAFAKPTTASTQNQGLAQVGAKLMGANPMLGAIAGGLFSLDDSYQDPTGRPSPRPGGAMGLAYDLNMSNQFANFESIKQAIAAEQTNYDEIDDIAGSSIPGIDRSTIGDVGFGIRIGGQVVSRGKGKRNYDGVYDLSTDQLRNLEALQRGKSTYLFNPLDPNSNDNLVGTGTNKIGYDETGMFHSINGVGYGKEADIAALGKEYGVSTSKAMSMLADVRSRTSFFSREIAGKNFTQMLEEERAKQQSKQITETESGDSSPEQKPTNTFTAAEVQANIDLDDNFTYSDNNDSNYSSTDSGTAPTSEAPSFDATTGGFKSGGRIGMQEGGNTAEPEVIQPAGFIERDPNATPQQEIADDIPLDGEKGDFVINAPAAKQAGKQDIEKMISSAITNLQEKGVDVRFGNPKMNIKDNINLLVSRNEVYIPKIVAEEIGYDRLDKMNNRGKREVARRQQKAEQPQQGMNEGGFIKKKDGGRLDEFGVEINEQMNPKTKKEIKKLISRSNITRGSIENLINKIPERDALAVMIFAESYASKDSPDAMRGIGETAINRMKDKTYSFKSQNKLKDVLKGRSTKGEGSKMFSYEGLEPKYIKPRLSEMLNSTYWQKAIDAADNALETEPDMEQYKLRDDVFTYARIGKASDRLKSNKRNEYFSTIGDHDFYSRTPEKGGRISSETMGESPDFYR